MWSIQDVAMNLSATPETRGYSDAMSFAFNCSDELAFSSLDVAKDNLKKSPYPQLAAFPMSFNKQVLLDLPVLPDGPRPERDRAGRQRHPVAPVPRAASTTRPRSTGVGPWPRA